MAFCNYQKGGSIIRYRDAKKLHNEDEVIRKSDGCVLRVVEVSVDSKIKTVFCLCDEKVYVHREIK